MSLSIDELALIYNNSTSLQDAVADNGDQLAKLKAIADLAKRELDNQGG